MNKQTQLLDFYFGSLEEAQRLNLERQMLEDTEFLLDYLDLKRKIEAAKEVPQKPSPFLWRRLQPQMKKRHWYFAAVAGAIAASILCFYVLRQPVSGTDLGEEPILFDSSSEHSFSSDVL